LFQVAKLTDRTYMHAMLDNPNRQRPSPEQAAERRALARADAEAAWKEYLGDAERLRENMARQRAARLARKTPTAPARTPARTAKRR
jgi:hypothetical protein